ncbi:MAG: Cu(I)/Ag(I) efflux system membrane protein CusA/SilA [Halioglobus sp.]|jgi:Cu(I)/Ag(I) efflux system membrane protein CusA/SilA
MKNEPTSLTHRLIRTCQNNQLIVVVLLLFSLFMGIMIAPFDWRLAGVSVSKVPVDAIPDIGENQQIVFTEWAGISPRDIEDQITYPLTSALLATPGVKTVRGFSMFGFSSIYVIFEENVDFYWSRSRILEKLNSLPSGTLPDGVQAVLGPDATALGQIFWYTIEGQDKQGNPTGCWSPEELRSVQDWVVRNALLSATGVSEVASVGGFVKEYQVDVDPDALKAFGVTLQDVLAAVKGSNVDVGARTMEVNKAEYIVRGVGLLESLKDLENTVIKAIDGQPIFLRNIGHISLGPALRRGALNKEGAEATGGVVVVRYDFNPLEAIENVKEKILEISPSLPQKVLADGTVSQLKIVPFYDRTVLINETLNTLSTALLLEILVTTIVVLVLLRHFRASLLIAGTLPMAVLLCFLAMKTFGVDANIVSLSGIAIAIGTMVDIGIVISESIVKRLDSGAEESHTESVYQGTCEVAGAVLTALSTTVAGFLPVFAMEAAEGKLFRPLAFTKTFALLSAMIIALTVIPAIASFILRPAKKKKSKAKIEWILVLPVAVILTFLWMPLGLEKGIISNALFVLFSLGGLLFGCYLFMWSYSDLLRLALQYKQRFLIIPASIVMFGMVIWLGIPGLYKGMDKEFMPPLDEGSFLFMPSTMPHSSITESLDLMQRQNILIDKIPEINGVVGKIGRVESSLDPAPISMAETFIDYHYEFLQDERGSSQFYKFDPEEVDFMRSVDGKPLLAPDGESYKVQGKFARDFENKLIEKRMGYPFPLWRQALDPGLNPGREWWRGIKNTNDIWQEITSEATIPGSTSAPKLQPIMTRIIMLQSGMRAPMGIKIKGPTLEVIEQTALQFEAALRQVPSIESDTVNADRLISKPYLEIKIDREALAPYGIKISDIQEVIMVAIGGKTMTTTIEGRERYPVRVRYMRELRDQIETIGDILVATPTGAHIPLKQLATVEYMSGPQVLKSEDGFLIAYLTFDMKPGYAEVSVVEDAQSHLDQKIFDGSIKVEDGVSYKFAGSFENQIRAEKKLALVIPVTLLIIFLILYLQFKSIYTSLFVFSGILVAWAGGFILIWFYGQSWFCNFDLFGMNMRELFQMHPINLSVAIWVGFLALFGIASDNGVLVAAVLDKEFSKEKPSSIERIRELTIIAAERRIRPALMTSATTILALLPVLTSSGRGADIMIPMAIPSFGGMLVSLVTIFVVPVLYCLRQERKFLHN